MNTISTIEKVPNYFHSHIDNPTKAIAVKPNTVLRILIKKKSVGLPAFIFDFIWVVVFMKTKGAMNQLYENK